MMMKELCNKMVTSFRRSLFTRGFSTAEAEAVPEAAKASPVVPPGGDLRLYRRITALGKTKGMVAETINEYLRQGRTVKKFMLDRCILELRKYRNYQRALEMTEWMERRGINFQYRDYAIRLDLIAKVHGIAAAETYFNSLSPFAKNQYTYGALLNCYCVEKMEDKALDLFDTMDKMEIASTLAFNNLMALHMRLEQPEKVVPLIQEMKKREMQLDTFTYNIWMKSSSCLNDIDGVERAFEEIKLDNRKECNWTTYSNLAVAYINGGLNEKAELALKKLEQEMRPYDREAFHYLITLYANISNLGEVHRVWNSLKTRFKVTTNMSNLIMLQALRKLNDIDGLKKCFQEWEANCSFYDVRLANAAIGAYLSHDMITEAEEVLAHAKERSQGPFFAALEMFMQFFLKENKIELALQCMKSATSLVEENEWQPKSETVEKFFDYFEEQGDVDGAEEFSNFLKKVNCLDYKAYLLLLQTYISAERAAPTLRKRIEDDGVEITDELGNLLDRVCLEDVVQPIISSAGNLQGDLLLAKLYTF